MKLEQCLGELNKRTESYKPFNLFNFVSYRKRNILYNKLSRPLCQLCCVVCKRVFLETGFKVLTAVLNKTNHRLNSDVFVAVSFSLECFWGLVLILLVVNTNIQKWKLLILTTYWRFKLIGKLIINSVLV